MDCSSAGVWGFGKAGPVAKKAANDSELCLPHSKTTTTNKLEKR